MASVVRECALTQNWCTCMDDDPLGGCNPNKYGVRMTEINDGLHLPTDKKLRKESPMARGLLDYFSDALFAVASVSFKSNEQHNPGQEMHWSWGKSNDHADCIIRHTADRGKFDDDGQRHSAKLAWRALALLQEELVAEGLANKPRAAR